MKHIALEKLLVALLGLATVLSLQACTDSEEPDDSQTPEEQRAQAQGWWDVVSQLTDAQPLPDDDVATATFEPTIGEASETDPYTRIVPTNDLATAAQRFADLVGASTIDEHTAIYTWTYEGAGTLSYQSGSEEDTYLAQVDVALKQMPTLKRILYMTPEQIGQNGSFAGTAYYRFGDVVRKENSEGYDDYWVCVRPAFGPEGKEDSHWVSLSDLPDENVKTYTYKRTGDRWFLPTGLGNSKEHMENFAEMLAAMHNPEEYFAVLGQDTKMKVFHDFKRNNLQYHNQYFWQRVNKVWNDLGLYEEVFGMNDDRALFETINRDGLNFIYNGYNGLHFPNVGWNLYLYQASYSGPNLKRSAYTQPYNNVQNMTFNVKDFNVRPERFQQFFGDTKRRFVLRYATGKQLCKDANGRAGTYNVKTALSNCEDVYVYNKYYFQRTPNKMCDLNQEPEVTVNADVTRGYFQPGTVIMDERGNRWVCYAGWFDNNEMTGAVSDRTARFISFDAVKGNQQEWTYGNQSALIANNLIPREEVALAAICLRSAAFPASNADRKLQASLRDYLGVNVADLVLQRDSVVRTARQTSTASILAMNLAYSPFEGHTGSQPILRYITDGTRVAGNRSDLEDNYRYHYFYTRISNDNYTQLDAAQRFRGYNQWNVERVPYDQWSHCMLHGTNQRDGDYYIANAYREGYSWDLFKYNTEARKWAYTEKNNGLTRPKYLSVFHEPITFVSYLAITDDDEDFFKGIYGRKKYGLVADPMSDNEKNTTFQFWYEYIHVILPYIFMDGQQVDDDTDDDE